MDWTGDPATFRRWEENHRRWRDRLGCGCAVLILGVAMAGAWAVTEWVIK